MIELEELEDMLRTGPPGWTEEYMVNPDEVPWWKAEGSSEERNRIRQRQYLRKWHDTHPKYNAEAMRKRNNKHPGYLVEAFRRLEERHPGYWKEASRKHRKQHPERVVEVRRKFTEKHPGYWNEASIKYHSTPKGRASLAKHNAMRRRHSTNPGLFGARIGLLRILQEPCANIDCQTPYTITHQIDHIIALCLGGTDDWSNLQPLCIKCHKKKTAEDMVKYKNSALLSPACIGTEFNNLRSIMNRNEKIC